MRNYSASSRASHRGCWPCRHQWPRDALVEAFALALARHELADEIQERDRWLTPTGRKVVEESVRAVAGGKVVEPRPGGHPRSAKDRQAAQNVGRSLDDVQALRRQLVDS